MNHYSIFTHTERFSTEEKCRDFLYQLRWSDGIVCPWCGNTHMNYYITNSKRYKCPRCRKQFSLFKGTIFEATKLPLRVWFHAIYMFVLNKRGISSVQLAKQLGIRQHSAWFMLHRLREALKDENKKQLEGVVSVDETAIGGILEHDRRLQVRKRIHDKRQEKLHGLTKRQRKKLNAPPKKRGRKKGTTKAVLEKRKGKYNEYSKREPFGHQLHILGMKSLSGELQLRIIGNSEKFKTRLHIEGLMAEHIKKTSIVFTDQGQFYNGLKDIYAGHFSLKHGKTFVENGIHTNDIENVWMHFKKHIKGTYFSVSQKHMERYLNEISFRWNTISMNPQEIVEDFLKRTITSGVREHQLIGHDSIKKAA